MSYADVNGISVYYEEPPAAFGQ